MNSITPRLPYIVVVTIGLILACFFGVSIGSASYLPLLLVVGIASFILYVTWFNKFTFSLGLLVIFTDFYWAPFGFKFGALELTCALGFGAAILYSWHNPSASKPKILQGAGFAFLQIILLVWLIYLFGHIFYNWRSPYKPQSFALANFLKSYFPLVAPFLMLLYFCRRPEGLRIPETLERRVIQFLIVGLIINILVRLYEIHLGVFAPDLELSDTPSPLYIPGINLIPGVYTLRTLGPFATLVCTVFLTARQKGKQYMASRWLIWLTLSMALFGAVISGGRATILFAIAVGGAVLFLRRRWLLLVVTGVTVIIGVALLNLFGDTIDRKAPFELARSLQFVLIHKNKVASSSIESSSNWRKELFLRALKEWESDPRIFWFGRATYAFTIDDLIAAARNGYEEEMTTCLRRGETHNLITNLLVTVGLVGLILYFTLIIAIIGFVYGLYRNRRLPPRLQNLSLICLIFVASFSAYALIGESILSIISIWFLIALIISAYRFQPTDEMPSLSDPHTLEPAERMALK